MRWLAVFLAATSCTTLLVQDFGQSSDDWQVWIEEVRRSDWGYAVSGLPWPTYGGCYDYEPSDPLLFPGGGGTYLPCEGSDFVVVVLRLQNRQPEPRSFDLTAARLAGDGHEAPPVLLDMNRGINWSAEPRPELDVGEEIVRKLYFNFPRELMPDRLIAAGLTIAFPAPAPAD